jgi:hypothetical protein
MPAHLSKILQRVFDKLLNLEGRVDGLEEHTCENRNRLEQLEEWQETVDDKLEAS